MRIGVPKEVEANEARVAATPATIAQFIKLGFEVIVESGAGVCAKFADDDYHAAHAIIGQTADVWQADIIVKVNAPTANEISVLQAGTVLISFIWPAQNPELLQTLADKGVTVLAMDAIPRISRAQSLDALSSMANIAGYRAIIEAAHQFGRFFTGQITAAGKVPAAKVLVIGAGVAGLAAIGTARSLGAIVRAFDTRPEVKEQVASMGADFLELQYEEESNRTDGYAKEMSAAFIEAEMALFLAQARDVDIIVTTALIPGRPAPKLITPEMVAAMKPGSIIVDLAAQTGGNCALTIADQIVTTDNNVKIIGYTDLPSRLATQSSQLYATNIVNLMKLLCKQKDGNVNVDWQDSVLRGVTVTKDNSITWPPPPVSVSAQPAQSQAKPSAPSMAPVAKKAPGFKYALSALAILCILWLVHFAPPQFLSHFTVFALSCVVGYYVVWNVTHALHTPLMSVTNAISGIIIIGALMQIAQGGMVTLLAFVAVLVASINIFGGFTVTQRMLNMFRKH